jgi:hypothetical protein
MKITVNVSYVYLSTTKQSPRRLGSAELLCVTKKNKARNFISAMSVGLRIYISYFDRSCKLS